MNLLSEFTRASAALHALYLAAYDAGETEMANDLHVYATSLAKTIGEYVKRNAAKAAQAMEGEVTT